MPKRKRNKCDEREYDYLAKKLKKLERKIKTGRRRLSNSSSDSDYISPHNLLESDNVVTVDDGAATPEAGCSHWDYWPAPAEQDEADSYSEDYDVSAPLLPSVVYVPPPPAPGAPATPEPPPPAPAPAPAAAPAQPHQVHSAEALAPATAAQPPAATTGPASDSIATTSSIPTVPSLDPSLLALLGEDPTSVKEYGSDVQSDLAIRLNHITTSGLTTENRKELKEKYLVPGNCKMIKAPSLNPEIRASLVESQIKRDKGIENKQNLNACAMASLSKAITLLLSSDNADQELLKLLMDTVRILGDIQHSDSVLRRFFILSTVKKDLKDQLDNTKIDNMLFSSNLADILKSAKTINRSGADLRPAVPSSARTSGPRHARTHARPLNYRAPPASRRPAPAGGARGARTTPAAPTSTARPPPAQHGYRTSWRQPPPRHRR